MLLQSSKDILYLMLAGGSGLLAVALTWLIVECALLLRNANRGIGEMRDRVKKVESALTGIREKLEHSAGYLALIAEGAKQVVKMVLDSRGNSDKFFRKKKKNGM